jgi:hypothetical protein
LNVQKGLHQQVDELLRKLRDFGISGSKIEAIRRAAGKGVFNLRRPNKIRGTRLWLRSVSHSGTGVHGFEEHRGGNEGFL